VREEAPWLETHRRWAAPDGGKSVRRRRSKTGCPQTLGSNAGWSNLRGVTLRMPKALRWAAWMRGTQKAAEGAAALFRAPAVQGRGRCWPLSCPVYGADDRGSLTEQTSLALAEAAPWPMERTLRLMQNPKRLPGTNCCSAGLPGSRRPCADRKPLERAGDRAWGLCLRPIIRRWAGTAWRTQNESCLNTPRSGKMPCAVVGRGEPCREKRHG